MQRVFTTGQVARIFSVNINTVIKWFDEEKLNGFRLPRSNERRIYRESVEAFMDEHGISHDLLTEFDEKQATKKSSRGRNRTPAPEVARGPEARAFPRTPVTLTGEIRGLDNTITTAVQVVNLSMGGALISGLDSTAGSLPVEFNLLVTSGDGAPPLDGRCQLVHVRRDKDQNLLLGVRFTQVDPGSLKTYLSTIS
ncbi:MAG: PilZ domain-containing protein [Bradymonadia bacterium]